MKKYLVAVAILGLVGLTRWLYVLVEEFENAPLVPSRVAMEGFKWKEISAHGMRLLTQDNGVMSLVAMADGFAMKREDGVALRPEIELLKKSRLETPEELIEEQFIGALTPEVQEACDVMAFVGTGEMKRNDVVRYRIAPKANIYLSTVAAREPGAMPCGAYGVRDATQYFEFHKRRPEQMWFVRVGQDAPLFDEESLRVR